MSFAAAAVFLDRDGVINRRAPEGGYITSVRQFVILPGAIDAIVRLNRSGVLVFVVTNQRCIARGLASPDDIAGIHECLEIAVAAAGGKIDRIYVCPHDSSDDCDCRKPKPGMLLQAAKEFGLNLDASWMIGDTPSDVSAGHLAGCHTVILGVSECGGADLAASDLADAVDKILARLSQLEVARGSDES